MTDCLRQTNRGLLLLTLATGLAMAPMATGAPEKDSKQAAKPVSDLALLISFRKPNLPAETRRDLANQLIERGPAVSLRLISVVSREFSSTQRDYLNKFYRAATKTAQLQLGSARGAKNEIEKMRGIVLGQAKLKADQLTKTMIKEKSDPALKRLNELLSVDASTVFEKNPKLEKQRLHMLETLNIWHSAYLAVSKSELPQAKKLKAPLEEAAFVAELEQKELLATSAATPMSSYDRKVLTMNFKLRSQLDAEETKGFLKLNIIRIQLGIGALAVDTKLVAASRGHSKDMATLKFFAHESPVSGKTSPWDRAKLAGTTSSGENIFMGRTDGNQATMAWWYSPGHHKNMLGLGHKRVGLGRDGKHWTQMFGR
jgi:uncharacterized protein YkwD